MTVVNNQNLNLNLDSNSNLIFIDANLDNYQTLVSGIDHAEVIILDPTQDGIEQITAALTNYKQLDSIQILSHGDSGSLQLGSASLNANTLNNYSSDLASWSDSLTDNGDILLFGCNLASGVAGIDLITNLSQLTNADIAASNDLTGNSQLGGDWDLEITTGEIEAAIALNDSARNAYDSVLVSYNGNDYQLTSGSLSWEQAQAEAVSLGGNLVTINDAAEENWLKQTFSNNERFWLGLTDKNQEGNFQWVSGENSTYRNWAAGEPNDYKFNGNFTAGEDYVQMNFAASRQWNDMPNSFAGTFRGIIEIEDTSPSSLGANIVTNGSFEDNTIAANAWGLVNNLPGWTPTIQSVIEVQEFGNGDDGTAWLELDSVGNGGVVQTLTTTANSDYQLSFAYSPRPNVASTSDGIAVYWDGQLIDTISRSGGSSNDWQTYTYNLTASNTSTPLEFRATGTSDRLGSFLDDVKVQPVGGSNPNNPGVIGLETNSYQVNEGDGTVAVTILRNQGSDGVVTVDYQTVDAAATAGLDYTANSGTVTFADGETSKTVTIPILDDNLEEGTEDFSFTIDNVVGGATLLAPRTALVNIEDNDSTSNTFTYNGNQYLLTSPDLTWSQAQAEAVSVGGNLVTINDASEETWLKENFSATEGFWIGINDIANEGNFEWVSGQAVTYTNWAPGEPNNGRGNQHFGWMNYSSTRQWDDHFPTAQLRGIIEIGGSNPSDDNGGGNNTLNSEILVSGLNQPTAIEWTPNGDRFFVAEKGGVIKVSQNGQVNNTPFIDLTAQVNGTRDRGLLDIAVHPDFFNGSPYVYALYTYDPPEVFQNTGLAGPDGNGNRASRLTRITADASTNFTTAVPGSEVVILGTNSTWDNFNGFANSTSDFNEAPAGILPDGTNLQDFLAADSESHTIGSVEFGPDGALYVSNGDGTSYNRVDPRTIRVQDIDNLSGKIIRIDPITGEGLADNPFYNGDSNANRSKVYQLGLRNPFRMTIDQRNGDVFVGDVGWTQWEEINSAGAGANFGWPYYEGGSGVNLQTGGYSTLPESQAFYNSGGSATPAILGLGHGNSGVNGIGINAIVLGDIYTGNALPQEYQGDLFFNDLGKGIVYNANFDDQGNVTSFNTFTTGANVVVQIIEAPDGSLYYVDLDDGLVGRWFFS